MSRSSDSSASSYSSSSSSSSSSSHASSSYDNDAYSQDLYHFQLDTTGTRVVSMTETDEGRVKSQSLRGWTFDLETDAAGDLLAVTRTQSQRGVVKSERYEDLDGDGAFVETFSTKVLTTAASALRADKARFSFDAAGDVVGQQELSKGRWKSESLDANESLELITLDGVDYVVKVEHETDSTEWALYRDDNGDGIWTEVAEVESNTVDSLVDLVGLADVLGQTAAVIG